eukprot:CAMPEP_0172448464 /NCGR_PEP_ID=MMETSP1065-20121228/7479_1 /TAXON_ID=265537 /ORGANISM="Amphiprora paludosa, Strain CCMP125" /LENGTH=873 /DNA_ID=CAMNT_0013199973 /DNA_START=32 /DNA_END=2653 /DNA_ORIENTATION=+
MPLLSANNKGGLRACYITCPMKYFNIFLAALVWQSEAFSTLSRYHAFRQSFFDCSVGKRSPGRLGRICSSPVEVETAEDQVASFRREADRMRKEAETLERELLLRKIEAIQQKLSNQAWMQKNADKQEDLERELTFLQKGLESSGSSASAPASTSTSAVQPKFTPQFAETQVVEEKDLASTKGGESSSSTIQRVDSTRPQVTPETPPRGFDEEDLEVYIPVAEKIQAGMTNATTAEKLAAFREAPELQDYFQQKIQKMLVKPMEDMRRLEELKGEYLQSVSKVEKMNIKREMEAIEKTIEADGPFSYSDSIFINIAPISEQELTKRVAAIDALPALLKVLYKQRVGLAEDGDISLGIQLDHYEQQVQLLEQIRIEGAVTDENKEEPMQALLSLPVPVRDHLAQKYGLEDSSDLNRLVESLTTMDKDVEWSAIQKLVIASSASNEDYDDIDFIDRSRYVEEFYPSLARLEEVLPPLEDVELFLGEVLDSRSFMVRSRPERVVGGYYIRGYNSISGEEDPGTRLVERLSAKLASSELRDRIQFFFINDPEPLSDEDFEMENGPDQIIFLTGKDDDLMTNNADGLTKAGVNILGLSVMFLFSYLTVELRPYNQVFENASPADMIGAALPVFFSLLTVQVAHEVGHKIAAMQGNMTTGFPTILPSVATGLGGAITPLRSPPPSVKALFDFAASGPLAGFLASLTLLIFGLAETSTLDISSSQTLPALPISLLKSSALGGEMIEIFLGSGALMSGAALPPDAMLSLHPAAVGGFIGLVTNALALLPLGNTDGGRIAVSMFGRRGTYVVSTATSVLLCSIGLFGFDQMNALLTYTLFSILWQRELEIPAINEVDQLDFVRGLVGIGMTFLVLLTLLPML